jgi:hypothetical protein
VTIGFIACVEVTTTSATTSTTPLPKTAVPSTTVPLSTTGTTTGAPSTTTTTLPPTTTTMNFCVAENGMNQPLTITSDQVQFDSPPTQSTDINPTPTTSGLTFTTSNPRISVTLTQPTTLTVIYLPVDRPNNPSNVKDFAVVLTYPNGTTSASYTSTSPSTSSPTTTTTPTPSAGAPSAGSTTPSPTAVVPLSDVSPRVDLPPNFDVPQNTVVTIMITSTTDGSNPTGVSNQFFVFMWVTYKQFLKEKKDTEKTLRLYEP